MAITQENRAVMSLIEELLQKPANLSSSAKYMIVQGIVYLGAGVLLIIWPGVIQTVLMEPAFVGHEQGLIRMVGLGVLVTGWLYLFGGLSGGRQVFASSVVDRLIFVPIVLVPLAVVGVFPLLLVLVTVLDVTLAVGAWVLLVREEVR